MFEPFHPYKGTIFYISIVTSSCILISRHDLVLSRKSIDLVSVSLAMMGQAKYISYYSMKYISFIPS